MSTNSEGIRKFVKGEFTKVEFISRGGQGSVSKVHHAEYGAMAVKLFLQKYSVHDKEQEKREIEYIAKQRHHHIIQFLGYIVEKGSSNIVGYVMEFMDGGSLFEVIHNKSIYYNLIHMTRWGSQASAALTWLHSEGILHRDVKPHNMLLTNMRKTLKICDFGSSRTKLLSVSMTMCVGTIPYMAPELLTEKDTGRYSKKCDVYSLGITLWEMATRKIPYELESTNPFALRKFIIGGGTLSAGLVGHEVLSEIIRKCLLAVDVKRPNMLDTQYELELLFWRCNIQFPEENVVCIVKIWNEEIADLAFNPNHNCIVSMYKDERIVRLWDFNGSKDDKCGADKLFGTSRLFENMPKQVTNNVSCFAWNSQGTFLATGHMDGNLCIWTYTDELELSRTEPIHTTKIDSLAWSSNDRYILTANGESAVVWEQINDENQIQKFEFKTSGMITKAVWINDDTFALYTIVQICVFTIGKERALRTYQMPNSMIMKVVVHPSSNILAALCSIPSSVRLWCLDYTTFKIGTEEDLKIIDIAFSPQSDVLAISAFQKNCSNGIYLYDVCKGVYVDKFGNIHGQKKGMQWSSLAFSPNGKYLVSGGFEHRIAIWNVQNGTLVQHYRGPDTFSHFMQIVWNHSSDGIATSDSRGNIVLFDVSHIARGETDYPVHQCIKEHNNREPSIDKNTPTNLNTDRCSLM